MNEQNNLQVKTLPYPSNNDRAGWQAYWQQQGQLWRSEPEIESERQQYLAECRAVKPDVRQGIYPFKDIKLNRADVEWLLATHENGRGLVDFSDGSQRQRVGLDLRGVDLRGVDLHNLPLARTIGDVAWREWPDLTEEQHILAAIHFEKADLKGAHLEGAELEYAFFEGTDLRQAHLQDANLAAAQMQRAYLERADFSGADFWLAHLFSLFLAMLTGYGYRMWRIVIVYMVAVSIFALLYFILSLHTPSPLTLEQSYILSITAFHGRVFSSPFVIGSAQSIVTAFEAVTGFVFEGVFIAMLAQRFFGK